ncbi:Protein of unknown function [Pyronema omphalodes CBS 100304]|uniref:Uncharacterized protein n=1 Tax=Pyronema omphalodes (strain CBS 100304) TaxID=1076935 RepID=U4L1G3_PYROM|nr:Protein of unknown function [Pyronema omphalodes CBS 100304]
MVTLREAEFGGRNPDLRGIGVLWPLTVLVCTTTFGCWVVILIYHIEQHEWYRKLKAKKPDNWRVALVLAFKDAFTTALTSILDLVLFL